MMCLCRHEGSGGNFLLYLIAAAPEFSLLTDKRGHKRVSQDSSSFPGRLEFSGHEEIAMRRQTGFEEQRRFSSGLGKPGLKAVPVFRLALMPVRPRL